MSKASRLVRRVPRLVLQRLYGFDHWHVGHGGEPYQEAIVRFLNARPDAGRQSVVDIGCGLGDILRRLRFASRLGLDRDAGAIAAARLLSVRPWRRRPRFEVFEFPGDSLAGTFDAIVMVNWIHQIDAARLRRAVHDYIAGHVRTGGCVILDTVDDPAYTYNHDVRALAPPDTDIELLGRYARNRNVWALRKTRPTHVP